MFLGLLHRRGRRGVRSRIATSPGSKRSGGIGATRQLARETWSEYFTALSKEMLNAPVSVEIIGESGPPLVEVCGAALLALAYDRRDDVFEVSAAGRGARLPGVLRHLVDHPARVSVDNRTMLAPITIEVDGPLNARTVITIEREPETTD